MIESTKQQLIQFVADLKDKDPAITWEEVAKRAQAEFSKAEGISLTSNAIRKRYLALLKKSEISKASNNKQQEEGIAMPSEPEGKLRQELLNYIENYIEKYMRPVIERVSVEAAQKVFVERFSYLQGIPSTMSTGYPPAPPMPDTVEGTRRHTIPRGKLAGTVDATLLELFESERKNRGFSVSRMLDVVLYTYFSIGRPEPPKLSFELSETSHSTEKE